MKPPAKRGMAVLKFGTKPGGRRRRPEGAPLEATAQCGGEAFSGALRIALGPSRVDPVLTPSEHGGRSARKLLRPESRTARPVQG